MLFGEGEAQVKEIWTAIVEKAVAKGEGSYEAIQARPRLAYRPTPRLVLTRCTSTSQNGLLPYVGTDAVYWTGLTSLRPLPVLTCVLGYRQGTAGVSVVLERVLGRAATYTRLLRVVLT